MEIITLQSVPSTNDFLKDYNRMYVLENFTIINAIEQTNGKGQMGNSWTSEKGKNLTCSVLIKNIPVQVTSIFILNTIVSKALVLVLSQHTIKNLSVKWPNDIMIGNKKVAGILIENSYKTNREIDAIIGIGLNVNQNSFENIKHATSLYNETKCFFDITDLLHEIGQAIKTEIHLFSEEKVNEYIITYNSFLYKKNIPTTFKNTSNNELFMGIIQKVSSDGKIHILKDDDTIETFTNKEIQYLLPSL